MLLDANKISYFLFKIGHFDRNFVSSLITPDLPRYIPSAFEGRDYSFELPESFFKTLAITHTMKPFFHFLKCIDFNMTSQVIGDTHLFAGPATLHKDTSCK